MLDKILADVKEELAKAELKHPSMPSFLLDPISDPLPYQLAKQAEYVQKENDIAEIAGVHSWYGLDREEMAEKYSAKTLDELYLETIQCAALHIRLAKQIKAGNVKIVMNSREI